jgi:hypothetical protein
MLDKKPYKRTAHMKVNRQANCRWIYQNLVEVVRYVVLKGFAFPAAMDVAGSTSRILGRDSVSSAGHAFPGSHFLEPTGSESHERAEQGDANCHQLSRDYPSRLVTRQLSL